MVSPAPCSTSGKIRTSELLTRISSRNAASCHARSYLSAHVNSRCEQSTNSNRRSLNGNSGRPAATYRSGAAATSWRNRSAASIRYWSLRSGDPYQCQTKLPWCSSTIPDVAGRLLRTASTSSAGSSSYAGSTAIASTPRSAASAVKPAPPAQQSSTDSGSSFRSNIASYSAYEREVTSTGLPFDGRLPVQPAVQGGRTRRQSQEQYRHEQTVQQHPSVPVIDDVHERIGI